MTEYNRKVG